VDVTLKVWPGLCHVFHSNEPALPEGLQAFREIGEFIQEHNPK